MTEKETINELDSIIAYCDMLKDKATGLRRRLTPVEEPASRKRGAVAPEIIAEVLAKRQKHRNKNALPPVFSQNKFRSFQNEKL